jgi:transcriptional regulatory protein LevR
MPPQTWQPSNNALVQTCFTGIRGNATRIDLLPCFNADEEKADWIIYVTDVGQSMHFDMVRDACQDALCFLARFVGALT